MKLNLPHFEFSILIHAPNKIGLNFCEMQNGNEACPTAISMKSGHRYQPEVVLASCM